MKAGAARGPGPVFAVPLIIAVATLAGLVAGLLGDGAADVISWGALGSCLLIILSAIWRRR